MSEVSTFLNQSSGSTHPAFKWDKVGLVLSGTIFEEPRVINRPNLNTGQPEDQLVIPVETGEGHQFALWVRRGFLAQAISDALKDASVSGLGVGGKLSVKHTEDRDTGRPQPARVFKAKYEPPVSTGVNPADIFGDDEPF